MFTRTKNSHDVWTILPKRSPICGRNTLVTVSPSTLNGLQLDRLLFKYRTLVRWRRAHLLGEPLPAKSEFRALSEEFPGALRELDTLPMTTLERRCEELELVVGDGAVALAWMIASEQYHRWMRAALWLKLRTRDGLADELAVACSGRFSLAVSVQFVRQIADPPQGRLRRVVFEQVCNTTGMTLEELQQELLPTLRSKLGP